MSLLGVGAWWFNIFPISLLFKSYSLLLLIKAVFHLFLHWSKINFYLFANNKNTFPCLLPCFALTIRGYWSATDWTTYPQYYSPAHAYWLFVTRPSNLYTWSAKVNINNSKVLCCWRINPIIIVSPQRYQTIGRFKITHTHGGLVPRFMREIQSRQVLAILVQTDHPLLNTHSGIGAISDKISPGNCHFHGWVVICSYMTAIPVWPSSGTMYAAI